MISVNDISKQYGKVEALKSVSFRVEQAEIFGLVGPDGAGKTSLFRIMTSLLLADKGSVTVDGLDVVADYQQVRERIGYMPGRFSLYQDLTVEENLNFFATLFNTSVEENYALIKDIYIQLEPFRRRPAGKLSGGMKQKLALCCALIHKPVVLFLDEPTTGVDPVSRVEFWEMLHQLKEQGITMVVSTPYKDEIAKCDRVGMISNGSIEYIGNPEEALRRYPQPLESRVNKERAKEYAIRVENLTKRFGDFTAVDSISFSVEKGEIFGFLGANGAGKTTAMRMLCGLSKPSAGKGEVAGYDISRQTEQVKKSIGYMSQKFSLYEDLTVEENMRLYAGIYGVKRKLLQQRIEDELAHLGLTDKRNVLVQDIPLGWKQKLAFSVATLHKPEVIFLDEPTGGVDPETRKQFWKMIYGAADRGTTIFVTTHYMDEAEYCNRISIMVDGKIEALDTPANLKKTYKAKDMDEVFYVLARKAYE